MTYRVLRSVSTLLTLCLVLSPSAALAIEASRELPFNGNPATLRINTIEGADVRNNFLISPTRFVESMAPGEERTVELRVFNQEGRPMRYRLSNEDFRAEPNDGSVQFFEVQGPYSAKEWITPEVKELELQHGQMAFIRVTIRVPASADPGDHMTGLIVQRSAAPSEEPGGFNILARVAALFIITVQGDAVRDGSVGPLTVKFWNWSLPVRMDIAAENRGSVHMAPEGAIEIRNIFGALVDSIPVNNWYVLRESRKHIALDWSPTFGLGYYTATTHLTLAGGTEKLPLQETSFVIIPLLLVCIVLLAIFVVSFLVQLFFSRFEIRMKPKENREKEENSQM